MELGVEMSTPLNGPLVWARSLRRRPAVDDAPGPGTGAGMGPEGFWDLHGSSLYALACALLGDEAAASRAVSSAMADLYASAAGEVQVTPTVTLCSAAAGVYDRCHAGLASASMERAGTTPRPVVLLGELAVAQRAALALCVFGGHTYHQAARRLDTRAEVAAGLLTSGLRDLGAARLGSDAVG